MSDKPNYSFLAFMASLMLMVFILVQFVCIPMFETVVRDIARQVVREELRVGGK